MMKLQDSAFTLLRTTNLSPAVCSYLQSTEIDSETTPIGGIFNDTKYGWLSLGPKFCVIDLRTGLKIAAWNFSGGLSTKKQWEVRCVETLQTPLTDRSMQLLISVEIEDNSSIICVFHVTGSQILHVIKTKGIITNITVADGVSDSPFSCFDGIVLCGTDIGEVFVFDLNRTLLLQALKDISQGEEDHIRNETKPAKFVFLPPSDISTIEDQRELAIDSDLHLGFILNHNSHLEDEYLYQNTDGSIRMRAKIGHVHISAIQYIPQLNSVAVGFNFGAFQIWNLMTLKLVFTSSVNVECLPVSHFGFQEPCDDPRASCYLWAIYSVIDSYEEDEFPLAVMYSLTYKGKRMLDENQYLYEELITSQIMYQLELSKIEGSSKEMVGGRCISCHTYSIPSTLGDGGEDSMLNLCQLVWECWNNKSKGTSQHGMVLFDLDQWYKAQMPSTYHLQSSPFMSAVHLELAHAETRTLDMRLCPSSVLRYNHATRLEEHFYPNALQYKCVCLNSSEISCISTVGIQRQIINGMNESGPTMLLAPNPLYRCCVSAGLHPMYDHGYNNCHNLEEQRRYLLSVALEARLSCFLKRCAHDWAAGAHATIGCTLTFLVDWSWERALTLKQNAKELIKPLFSSCSVPDWNVRQNLEHCIRQLTQLTSLLDDVLTKCCNLVVPDALSEIEEKFKGIGTVSLYFQVVQWFLTVGLLPEKQDLINADFAPLLGDHLVEIYQKRRMKLHRLMDESPDDPRNTSCALLYVDQLIENECGGELVTEMWRSSGSRCGGLYPPPSLSALLRLYLMPTVPQQHKHALVLYMLLDYCMLYESQHQIPYEGTIKRLMQFPTLFGLSNTAIKATQAFWHLDHRDFDFALDQLQCLTGNTLSPWQHHVVLSSLLAQKKTQAALQYLHVRKPPPIQLDAQLTANRKDEHTVNDHVKLEDWQSSCDLYLARGLVFEALDVVRLVSQNSDDVDDKIHVMNYFYNGCKNTGQLSKVLKLSLLPYEEEIFIKYLESCDDPQTSDILVMYLLQQARYIEAQQYNTKIKTQTRADYRNSALSLSDGRDSARDILVDVMCSSQPNITHTVAQLVAQRGDSSPVHHVLAPKPMSVFVQANSPKNTFTYKSTFIQDTIENASETWMNKPALKRGLKRILNVEDTPFICTPKLNKSSKSIFSESRTKFDDHTPSKRPKLDFSTPKQSASPPAVKLSAKVMREMESLLEMPDLTVVSPPWDRMSRDHTPHSILKSRRRTDDEASSVGSPVSLVDSEDAYDSVRTPRSQSLAKHLQFTIPSDSPEPSRCLRTPDVADIPEESAEQDITSDIDAMDEDTNVSTRKNEEENHPLESPPKKLATERVMKRRSYKDSVRSRSSLSLPINSSLSDDPNSSIESIADIPFTLINARLAQYRPRSAETDLQPSEISTERDTIKSRRAIRPYAGLMAESVNRTRSRSSTPINVDTSPPAEVTRNLRSRSRSSTRINVDTSPPPEVSRNLRSRSKTQERISTTATDELEVIPQQYTQKDTLPQEENQEKQAEIQESDGVQELSVCEKSESENTVPIDITVEQTADTQSSPAQAPTTPRLRNKGERKDISAPMEIVSEASSNSDDSDVSKTSRHSDRCKTPEGEMLELGEKPSTSSRILRSRSKTPERESRKVITPKPGSKSRKSLSRLVLEANAFKTHTLERHEAEINESENNSVLKDDSGSLGTPVKQDISPVNLLDVTLSPITDKSVLQTPTDESLIFDTSDKEVVAKINIELPKLNTLEETSFEKSVLKSYESSLADDSEEMEICKNEDIVVPQKLNESFNITPGENKSVLQDVSSLITSDSNVDINETSQVSEIVEENELPNAPSEDESIDTNDSDENEESEEEDDSDNEGDNDSDKENRDTNRMDQDIEIPLQYEVSEGSESAEGSESENEEAEDDEVITLDDSMQNSNSESESIKLHIEVNEDEDEVMDSRESEETHNVNVTIIEEESNNIGDDDKHRELSILTDDNSVLVTDDSSLHVDSIAEINKIAGFGKKLNDEPMDKDPETQLQVNIFVNRIEEDSIDVGTEPNPLEIDVVDAVTPTNIPSILGKPEQVIDMDDASKVDDRKDVAPIKATSTLGKTEEPLKSKIDTKEDTPTNKSSILDKTEQSMKLPLESKADSDKNITLTVKTSISEISEEPIKLLLESKDDKNKDISEQPIELPLNVDKEPTSKAIVLTSNVYIKTIGDDLTLNKPEQPLELPLESKVDNSKDTTTTTLKRTRSSRGKSIEKAEEKTPVRRTRANSNANMEAPKPMEETPITPSRRRLRTPSADSDVRRIMTRRASKELSESFLEEDTENTSVALTPSRRTRSKSKPIDDNIKISDKNDSENEPKPIKGRRRSILNAKIGTDLGVIPETTEDVGEGTGEKATDIIREYVQGSRDSNVTTTQTHETNVQNKCLTRTQKQTLETWLDESKASPQKTEQVSRPRKGGSRASMSKEDSAVNDLLSDNTRVNKTHSKGIPVSKELASTEPLAKNVTPKARISRAMSESKTINKNAPTRRLSVDINNLADSPSGLGSPRERRACFTRAVEALHTPKGRRTSVDKRSEAGSNPGSPVQTKEECVTPISRRGRRASTSAQAQPDTPTRSKKN